MQYSLRGVQAVNESDQYGGCPQEDVRTESVEYFSSNAYCASGIGVITDGMTDIEDVSQPGWAGGLLTINTDSSNLIPVLELKLQAVVFLQKLTNIQILGSL